jgi:ABC-type sugar transport system permease subunit
MLEHLIRPIVGLLLGIAIFYFIFEDPPIFILIFFAVVITWDLTTKFWKYHDGKRTKHIFFIKDGVVSYSRKKDYTVEHEEEIPVNEMILQYRQYTRAKSNVEYRTASILKSSDDGFKLKIKALTYRYNLKKFIEFFSMEKQGDEPDEGIDELADYNQFWAVRPSPSVTSGESVKSADISAAISQFESGQEWGGMGTVFLAVFSVGWVGMTSIVAVLFLTAESGIFAHFYVLLFLSPFILVSVVIIHLWISKLLGSNSEQAIDGKEQQETAHEVEDEQGAPPQEGEVLRATAKSKQE